MTKGFEQEWADIQADPAWASLPAAKKQRLARTFAQTIARQEVPGNHPRMKAFLEQNVVGKSERPSTKSAFGEGLREGFDQSAAGIVTNAVTGRRQHSGPGFLQNLKDAGSDLFLPGGGNSLIGEGSLRGATGAMGAMVGQAPDILAGGVAAKGLTAGAARLGLGATASQVAGGVGSNALIAGGSTKIAGGTNSDAAKAAALAGAMGLMPLAAKVPAGRFNPNIIKPAPPPTKIPMVDLQRRVLPPSQEARGVAMVPFQGKPQPITPSVIQAPPAGFVDPTVLRQPLALPAPRDQMVGPNQFANDAAILAGPAPQEVARNMGLEAALYNQFGKPFDAMAGSLRDSGATVPRAPRPAAQLSEADARALLGQSFTDEASTMGLLGAIRNPSPVARRIQSEFARENPPLAPVPRGAMSKTEPTPSVQRTSGDLTPDEFAAFRATRAASRPVTDGIPGAVREGIVGPGRESAPLPSSADEWAAQMRADMGLPEPAAPTRTSADLTLDDIRGLRDRSRGMPPESAPAAELVRTGSDLTTNEYLALKAARKKGAVNASQIPGALREGIIGPGRETTKGKPGPKGEPPEWGGIVKRLVLEEEGTFDPHAMYDGLEAAAGAAGRAVGRGATVVGRQALRAADAVKDVAARAGDVMEAPKAAADALAARVGYTRGVQAVEAARQIGKHRPANTPFPALNAALDGARKMFISDYGMPPEAIAAREAWKAHAAAKADKMRAVAVDINNRRTGAEQYDLHIQATEPTYKGAIDPDAQAVKAASNNLSDEMLAVEALTPDAHAKYRDHYLPREFAKHFPSLAKTAQVLFDSARGLSGYYHRGLTETMSQAALQKRIAAGETWQVQQTFANGSVKAWRDWTPAERLKWGEIRHVGRAMMRMADRAQREIEKGGWLQELKGLSDANGAFAVDAKTLLAAGQKLRDLPDVMDINGQKYVFFNDKAAKTSGVKKWGALANHYVRDDLAFGLRTQFELAPFVRTANDVLLNNLWKKMVTIGNFPGYFFNNFMMNMPTLELAGGSIADLPGAAVKLANNDSLIQQLADAGVIRNGVLARELGSQMTALSKNLTSAHVHGGISLSKLITRAQEGLRGYEMNAYRVSGATDDMYRVALVDGLMRRGGMSLDEAALVARDAFYSGENVTAPAAQLASIVSPFVRVMWWTVDQMPALYARNPGRGTMLAAMVGVVPWLLNKAMGKDDATIDAEEAAKPEHMKGYGNSVPVGRDSTGQPLYWDTSNYNPGGMFNTNPNSALPGMLRGASPGGYPWMAAQMALNKDSFTGRDLVKKDLHGNVLEDNRGSFVARNVIPGTLRNVAGVAGAAAGRSTPYGNRVDLPTALIRTAGIKVNPVNVEEARGKEAGKMRADIAEWGRQISRRRRLLATAYERGDEGSIQALQAEIEELNERRRAAREAGQERMRVMTPPGSEEAPE